MNLKFLFPLLLLFIAACVPTPLPSSTIPTSIPTSASMDGGIYGNVTIGPSCPVMQVNDPCPDKPYQATFTILTTDQRKVMQFQTDASGYFKVNLAAGEYTLHPESPNAMPRAKDIPFTVKSNQFTQVNVSFDSGMR